MYISKLVPIDMTMATMMNGAKQRQQEVDATQTTSLWKSIKGRDDAMKARRKKSAAFALTTTDRLG